MNISKNIANLIDKHSGIFTFGFKSYPDEELLNLFLNNYVFTEVTKKELIKIENLESSSDIKKLNFTHKVFIVDLNLIPIPKSVSESYKEKRLFAYNLHEFCAANNNIAIVLTSLLYNLSTSTYKPPDNVLINSNTAWNLDEFKLKNIKNRYGLDEKSYNLVAYIRDKRIDQILSEE
jgi:hypothetical protein